MWLGLTLVASPSSATAGNVPPAVQPPLLEENSVRATAPLLIRTAPAVAVMAVSLRAAVAWRKAPPRACAEVGPKHRKIPGTTRKTFRI